MDQSPEDAHLWSVQPVINGYRTSEGHREPYDEKPNHMEMSPTCHCNGREVA